MSTWLIAFVLMLNIILQSTVFQYIAIRGVKPDTAIAIIVALSTFLGKEYGMVIAIAAGMLQDILFAVPVGITALAYMPAAYLIGANNDKIFKENFVVPLAFTAGVTLLKYCVVMFFNYVLGIEIQLLKYINQYLLIELVYNCAVSVVIYKVLYWVYRRKSMDDGLNIKRKR